ncbi:MAG TPA: tRNA epoxyqueuosine(34) reductase QueG [Tepidiformaceae bacterium]|nr:tRNA epoxyqueuosine(34) reductase QueG [Tepidiformaceae bacterium]
MTGDTSATRAALLQMVRDEGFNLVRIAPAGIVAEARAAAHGAYEYGALDGMGWITSDWLDRATDPGRFLDGACSVIIVALSYGSADANHKPSDGIARGRVAAYAHGRDYHRIFEKKLRRIARRLREDFGAQARATVDYGPLLERPLAAAAGLGWQGKSTMLLVPGFGPWVMLGAIATTLELAPDQPLRKTCGSCIRCITACPTGALSGDGGLVDSRLCISYHTIENRGPIPRELRASFGDWIFGCDACLDACPVGQPGRDAHPELLAQSPDSADPPLAELLTLDDAAFLERFRGRPVMRAKRDGFLRNVCIALGNVGHRDDVAPLTRALDDFAPLVRGHAAWAIGRLAERGVISQAEAVTPLEKRRAIEHDPLVREELAAALVPLTSGDAL